MTKLKNVLSSPGKIAIFALCVILVAALLAFLFRNAGQVLPRALLLDRVWGADSEVEEGNLNNYIFFARRRLQQVGSRVQIQTVRGLGYRAGEC